VWPTEAVGVLITDRRIGQPDLIDGFGKLANVHEDPWSHFAVDPEHQLRLWADMDRNEADPVAIWHSHTSGVDVPSADDVESHDPSLLLGLLCLHNPLNPKLKLFRVINDLAVPEPLTVECTPTRRG
jgi:proteasome lid subunit RPN8/RPN11